MDSLLNPLLLGGSLVQPRNPLPRSGFGLHVADPETFPLPLHAASQAHVSGGDSDSDDDALIQCSSQPVVCAGCKQTSAGGGPASSSLFRCSYCERAFHPGCVSGLNASTSPQQYRSWACPFCAKVAIEQRGVRVMVNTQGHHVPAVAPAPQAATAAPHTSSKTKALPSGLPSAAARGGSNGAGGKAEKRKAANGKGAGSKVKKPRQPSASSRAAATRTRFPANADIKAKPKATLRSMKGKAARKAHKAAPAARSPPHDSGSSDIDSDDEGNRRSVDEFGRSVELLTVTITELPLGIGFDTRGGPQYLAIHHFNPAPDGDPRQAEKSGLLLKGDQLVVVSDVEVQPLKFKEVVRLLRTAQLPLRLQFLRTTAHHVSAHTCWHSWVFEAACRLGPDVSLEHILRSAQKDAGVFKKSHPKLTKQVKADLVAVRKATCGPSCCKKAASIFKVNVPFSAYHPGHGVTSNPSLQATPVRTADLNAKRKPNGGGGRGADAAGASAAPLTAANLTPKTAISDVHGGMLCPDCHCPLKASSASCTWYFQCPQCQAILQNEVKKQDVVLNSMVAYLKLQTPQEVQQKLLRQSADQYKSQLAFFDAEIVKLQEKRAEFQTKLAAVKAMLVDDAKSASGRGGAGGGGTVAWSALQSLAK